MTIEVKEKHLEFVQNAITRMGSNSFQLKGWCISIVAIILGFATADKGNPIFVVPIAFMPIVLFWYLDGYFLWQERLFRDLYDDVRIGKVIGYEMNHYAYNFDPTEKEQEKKMKERNSHESAMKSDTLKSFYGIMILITLFVWIVLAIAKLKGL